MKLIIYIIRYLEDNQLSGTIPESFGNLTILSDLYIFLI